MRPFGKAMRSFARLFEDKMVVGPAAYPEPKDALFTKKRTPAPGGGGV
jgi:hypothetical protein